MYRLVRAPPVAAQSGTPAMADRPAAVNRNSLAAASTYSRGARVGRVALLAAVDLSALLVSGLVAYLLWALPMKQQAIAIYSGLTPLLSLFILGYAQAGL